uniref:Uncharacterized protein n=1 Tax=Rhipicephalus zambeziensis TaxID=60191 RepID=A0A224YC24_9ACAR
MLHTVVVLEARCISPFNCLTSIVVKFWKVWVNIFFFFYGRTCTTAIICKANSLLLLNLFLFLFFSHRESSIHRSACCVLV